MDFFSLFAKLPSCECSSQLFWCCLQSKCTGHRQQIWEGTTTWWHTQWISNMHEHKQTHLRNARLLRWGKLLAHTLLKCWPDTGVRSVFPHCNSSAYQPLTSDFCPAGMCTSSVSGCTTPYVSIRPCNHLVVESERCVCVCERAIHTF